MKKLTAGIFTVLVALVSANGANAAIATQGYVDQEVGKVSTDLSNNYSTTTKMNEAIATAKSGAEETAAADATEKANKALADAKAYVSGELGVLSAGAAETLNKVTANEQAIEGLLDTVADMDDAYKAADTKIREDFAAADTALETKITNAYGAADTQIRTDFAAADTKIREDFAAADATTLADAKKYADDQDAAQTTTITAAYKLADTNLETSLKQYADEKAAAASGDASEVASDLAEYKTANNAAVKAADDKAVAAQGEVDALEIVVATNKSETDAAILDITKTDGTIDTKVKASADVLEGKIAAANTAAGNAETNAKAYALEKSNAALTAAVGYTDKLVGKLPNIARVPNTCSDSTNYCTLTTNGTDFYWEVIKRATGEKIENDAAPLVSMTEAKPEELN